MTPLAIHNVELLESKRWAKARRGEAGGSGRKRGRGYVSEGLGRLGVGRVPGQTGTDCRDWGRDVELSSRPTLYLLMDHRPVHDIESNGPKVLDNAKFSLQLSKINFQKVAFDH
ncbi:hypothetical protein J6590_024926 [Homalodisca vitripennis]|nr:hypothetical protein J6590_024926 [Homalodisca vitripennis]